MKTIVSTLAASAIALTGIASALSVPVLAQSDNAATITKDFGCGGFVPTEDGDFGSGLFSAEGSHSVATSSGNTKLVCHFDIPEGLEPARATHAEGFVCGTFLGLTTDSKMVATPGGTATLTCSVKGS